VLLDVEGTTTPAAFVHERLFPYSIAHMEEYLQRCIGDARVADELARLRDEYASDRRRGLAVPPWPSGCRANWIASAARYARWLIERDRKSTPLKVLQGLIWEDGYESGELVGQLYPDVAGAIERWHRQGRRVAIFSSGSVLAQRLLFGHSIAGDLTPLLDSYYDTGTGPKMDPDSYRAIARELDVSPPLVLFVSDSLAELDAAAKAGMRTCLSVRTSDPPAVATHPFVASFEGLAAAA